MRRWGRIVAVAVCVAVVCGAAVGWRVHRHRVSEHSFAEQVATLRTRAERGDAKAEAGLGSMYYYGYGAPQDYGEAVQWYRKAAGQGAALGEYDLGLMYDLGRGVPQDYGEAIRWYQRAADQGDAGGEFGLGSMYYYGRGVTQDYGEAARWYRKAADQGLARAEYGLGYMYRYGKGVGQDRAEADRWFEKAAGKGNADAEYALGLRGGGLSLWYEVCLGAGLFLCLVNLKTSLTLGSGPRARRQALEGLVGLGFLGMRSYRAYGSFHSVPVFYAYHSVEALLLGAWSAMILSPVIRPRKAKAVLETVGVILLGFNLVAIPYHHLVRPFLWVRVLTTIDGLLVGASIPVAILVWRERDGVDEGSS